MWENLIFLTHFKISKLSLLKVNLDYVWDANKLIVFKAF